MASSKEMKLMFALRHQVSYIFFFFLSQSTEDKLHQCVAGVHFPSWLANTNWSAAIYEPSTWYFFTKSYFKSDMFLSESFPHAFFLERSWNLHFPGSQTFWNTTAQHSGLEFQVFNVSILPFMVQQPVQRQTNTNRLNSMVLETPQTCLRSVHDYPWHKDRRS